MNKVWILAFLVLLVPTVAADITYSGYYDPGVHYFDGTFTPTSGWYRPVGACATNVNCYWETGYDMHRSTGVSGDWGMVLNTPAQTGDWSIEIQWALSRCVTTDCTQYPTVSSPGVGVGLTLYKGVFGSGTPTLAMADTFSTVGGVPTATANNWFTTGATNDAGSIGCGQTITAATDSPGTSGHTVISFTKATNTYFITDTHGVSCTGVNSNYATFTHFIISGGGAGCSTTSLHNGSCRVFVSNLIYNPHDGSTFTVDSPPTVVEQPDFDEGVKGFAASIGFRTPNSEMLLVLIFIALTGIGMAFLTRMFGEGPGRTWLIHGGMVLIGVFTVLLLWLKLWIFVIALVIGTVGVRGAKEFTNTFRSLTQRIGYGAGQPVADAPAEPIDVTQDVASSQPEPEPDAEPESDAVELDE